MSPRSSKRAPLLAMLSSSVAMMLVATELALWDGLVRRPGASALPTVLVVVGCGLLGGLATWIRFPFAIVLPVIGVAYWSEARTLSMSAILALSLTLVARTRLFPASNGAVPAPLLAACSGWLFGFALLFFVLAELGTSRAWPIVLIAWVGATLFGVLALVVAKRRAQAKVEGGSSVPERMGRPFLAGFACWLAGIGVLIATAIVFEAYDWQGGSSAADAWQPYYEISPSQ